MQFYKTSGKPNIVFCCHLNNKMPYLRLLVSMKVATIQCRKKTSMFTTFITPMKSQRKHFIVYFNILKIDCVIYMIYAILRWPFCNWPPNVVFFHLQFNTWMQNLKSVCVKLVTEPNLFFISKYHYDIWGNDLKIERCPLFIKYLTTKNQSLSWDYYTRINITLKTVGRWND